MKKGSEVEHTSRADLVGVDLATRTKWQKLAEGVLRNEKRVSTELVEFEDWCTKDSGSPMGSAKKRTLF